MKQSATKWISLVVIFLMLIPIAYYPVIALSDDAFTDSQNIIGNTEMIDIISHQEYVSQELIEYRTTQFDGWHWNNNTIYSSNNEIIYTAPGIVTYAYVTNNAVFYLSENKLYRFHFASNANDELTSVPSACYDIYPITNHTIILHLPNPEYDESDDLSQPYISWYYDGLSQEKISTTISNRIDSLISHKLYEHSDSLHDVQTHTNLIVSSGTYTINACPLPLSNYLTGTSSSFPNGWFFNRQTHNASQADMIAIPGYQPCPSHNDTSYCKNYQNCWQCMGFALYVYNRIWGRDWDTSLERINKYTSLANLTSSQMHALFSEIPIGAHVRVQNSQIDHSFILLSYDANSITYYQANDGVRCHVSIWKQTWYEFCSQYNQLYYYHHPDRATCNHSYNLTGANNTLMHQRKCANCNAISWNNHSNTYSNKTSTTHYQSCWVCGYAATVAHTWTYGAWSSGQRTVTCLYCKYSYIQYQ